MRGVDGARANQREIDGDTAQIVLRESWLFPIDAGPAAHPEGVPPHRRSWLAAIFH